MSKEDFWSIHFSLSKSCIISSTVFLYVLNDPIIESSSNLKFAPYNVAYPLLDQHVQQAGFDPSKSLNQLMLTLDVNKWDLIFDFTKKDDSKLNYEFLNPSEFHLITKELEDFSEKPV